MYKIILSGGGTAGHANPAIAIAEIIKQAYPDTKFLYVGTPNGIEKDIASSYGIEYAEMNVAGFQRHLSLNNIKRNLIALKYLAQSGKRCKEILDTFKPDLVIGTGGYVCGPIVKAASQRGIKTLLHEQNAFPGVTTKLLASNVSKVMLTVEKAGQHLKSTENCVVTGLPVKSGFLQGRLSKTEAKKQLGLDPEKLCVLSTGGSLGAGKINETVADLLGYYVKNGVEVSHIHSYGRNGRGSFAAQLSQNGVDLASNPQFIVKEFFTNMPVCMAAADLIISRCGASTLMEIEAVGCGSVLVPSPIVAENHQYHNGMVLVNAGAAVLYEQKDLTSEILIETVNELLQDPEKLASLSENAKNLYISDTPQRVLAVIEEVLKG